jgi:hypothetical protein
VFENYLKCKISSESAPILRRIPIAELARHSAKRRASSTGPGAAAGRGGGCGAGTSGGAGAPAAGRNIRFHCSGFIRNSFFKKRDKTAVCSFILFAYPAQKTVYFIKHK